MKEEKILMTEKEIRRYEWTLEGLERALQDDLRRNGILIDADDKEITLKPEIDVTDKPPSLKLMALEVLYNKKNYSDQ